MDEDKIVFKQRNSHLTSSNENFFVKGLDIEIVSGSFLQYSDNLIT